MGKKRSKIDLIYFFKILKKEKERKKKKNVR